MKYLFKIGISIVFTFVLFGCGKDNDSTQQLPELSVIDVSAETNWDYMVVGKSDYYYIKANNNLPSAVVFHSKEANKDYSIFFTNNGLIDKVAVDGYIFIFRNFNGHSVDIGQISPAGEINTFRNVITPDYDWDNLQLSAKNSQAQNWSDVVRWTGRIVAGVPCAISVVAAIHTAGVLAPVAAWECGNFILSLSADISSNDFNVHNGFTDAINAWGNVSLVQSCSSDLTGTGCLTSLASSAMSNWADNLEAIENSRSGDILITTAALENGYGDVQITLTWDNETDLDLHVFDPSGEEIWFDHPYSASNGILDVDDIDGYGPENIYWPSGQSPVGMYQVYIHDYDDYGLGNSNYTVLVNAYGKIEKFTGSISYDQTVHIKDFDQNGAKSASKKPTISYALKKK